MAAALQCRPSALAGINDPYEAWCLDEAVCQIIAARRSKRRLKPRHKGQGNTELIRQLTSKAGEVKKDGQ